MEIGTCPGTAILARHIVCPSSVCLSARLVTLHRLSELFELESIHSFRLPAKTIRRNLFVFRTSLNGHIHVLSLGDEIVIEPTRVYNHTTVHTVPRQHYARDISDKGFLRVARYPFRKNKSAIGIARNHHQSRQRLHVTSTKNAQRIIYNSLTDKVV